MFEDDGAWQPQQPRYENALFGKTKITSKLPEES
jgi:hypothetical protein